MSRLMCSVTTLRATPAKITCVWLMAPPSGGSRNEAYWDF